MDQGLQCKAKMLNKENLTLSKHVFNLLNMVATARVGPGHSQELHSGERESEGPKHLGHQLSLSEVRYQGAGVKVEQLNFEPALQNGLPVA